MAAGRSSRYLGKGGDGESGRRGGPALPVPPPPYHRSRASSCRRGPVRLRTTSSWRARTAAQRPGCSQPHSPRADAMVAGGTRARRDRTRGASLANFWKEDPRMRGAGPPGAGLGSAPDGGRRGARRAEHTPSRSAPHRVRRTRGTAHPRGPCAPLAPPRGAGSSGGGALDRARADRGARAAGSGCGHRLGRARSLGTEPGPCRAAP